MAIAALVLGIIGTILSLFPVVGYMVGIPLSVVAVILGIVSRKTAAANNQPTGSATAGMALGIVGLIVGILMFVACVLLGSAATSLSDQAQKDPHFQTLQDNPQWKKAMDDLDKQMKEQTRAAQQPAPLPPPAEKPAK